MSNSNSKPVSDYDQLKPEFKGVRVYGGEEFTSTGVVRGTTKMKRDKIFLESRSGFVGIKAGTLKMSLDGSTFYSMEQIGEALEMYGRMDGGFSV